jgi:hypothetical protein
MSGTPRRQEKYGENSTGIVFSAHFLASNRFGVPFVLNSMLPATSANGKLVSAKFMPEPA